MPMSQKIEIQEEARKYFTKHYPLASKSEIDKQVEDWVNKASVSKSLVDFFTQRVGVVKDKKILDVGFGSGGIVIAFSQAGGVLSGVEVDTELGDIARKNLEANNVSADLRIYNGTDFPFPDNTFDHVVSFSVMEHVSYPEKVISEMLRVLKPSGRILLTLPNKYYPKETHSLVYFVSYMPRSLANLYLRILKRSPLEHDNLHFYSYFDIMRFLKNSKYKYELVYKDISQISGFKKVFVTFFKKLNIHYTIFLKQLIFVIEKK